jgi:hypothetical protein
VLRSRVCAAALAEPPYGYRCRVSGVIRSPSGSESRTRCAVVERLLDDLAPCGSIRPRPVVMRRPRHPADEAHTYWMDRLSALSRPMRKPRAIREQAASPGQRPADRLKLGDT